MLTLGYRTATREELTNQQNPNAGNSRVGVNPSVKIIRCQQQFRAIAKLGPSGMGWVRIRPHANGFVCCAYQRRD